MLCFKGYRIPRRDILSARYVAAQCGRNKARVDTCTDNYIKSAQINRRPCKFCKDFHDPDKYCFRLRIVKVKAMSHKRKRSRRDHGDSDPSSSSSESSGSGDRKEFFPDRSDDDNSDDSAKGETTADAGRPVEDSFDPPYWSLEGFYESKKCIDAHDVKLVL